MSDRPGDVRLWAEHHHEATAFVEGVVRKVREAFAALASIQYDAPWERAPECRSPRARAPRVG